MALTPFHLWPTGDSPLVETFTETTAVEAAFDGTERRDKCRAFPRYQLSATFEAWDEELDALEALVGQPLQVPAWMHPLQAGVVSAVHGPGAGRLFFGSTAAGVAPAFFTGTVDGANELTVPTFGRAVPALEMQLAEESFDVQIRGRAACASSLAFVTDQCFEPIPAYTGPLSAGLPLLETKHNWTAKPTKQTAFNQNRFDNGNLALIETRHLKRSVGVRFDLFGLDEIRAFRLFFRQLRGRYQAFRWVAFDGVERTYRLAADSWALEYRGTHNAGCSLRFVEL